MSLEWKKTLGNLRITMTDSIKEGYFARYCGIYDLEMEAIEKENFVHLSIFNGRQYSGITFVLYMEKEKFAKRLYRKELIKFFNFSTKMVLKVSKHIKFLLFMSVLSFTK